MEKNRHKTIDIKGIFFSLITFAALFLIAILLGIKHQSNDDFELIMIVRGMYPYDTSPFLFYSSKLLGVIYQLFYQLSDKLEWYNLIYLILVTFSFTCIFKILFQDQRHKLNFKILVFLIYYLWAFLLVFITNVQFTLAAGILAGNAFLKLFYFSLGGRKISTLQVIFIFIELVLSSIYRFDMFMLISGMYVSAQLLHNVIFTQKIFTKRTLLVLSMIALPFFIHLVEINTYSEKEKSFIKFHKARAEFGDFMFFTKVSNRDQLEKEANWSEDDFVLLRNWAYPDFPQFREKALSKIVENGDKGKLLSGKYMVTNLRYILNELVYNNHQLILLIILFLILVSDIYNEKYFVFLIFLVSIYIFSFFILSYFLKAPDKNVYTPVFSFILLLLLIVYQEKQIADSFKFKKLHLFTLLICAFLVVQNFRIKHKIELIDYNEIDSIENAIKNKGVLEIYSLPMSYLGSHYFTGINIQKEKDLKVFYCGMFFNHPTNIAFKSKWEIQSFLESLKTGIYFYFPENRISDFDKALCNSIKNQYKVNIRSERINLESNLGYLVRLQSDN